MPAACMLCCVVDPLWHSLATIPSLPECRVPLEFNGLNALDPCKQRHRTGSQFTERNQFMYYMVLYQCHCTHRWLVNRSLWSLLLDRQRMQVGVRSRVCLALGQLICSKWLKNHPTQPWEKCEDFLVHFAIRHLQYSSWMALRTRVGSADNCLHQVYFYAFVVRMAAEVIALGSAWLSQVFFIKCW